MNDKQIEQQIKRAVAGLPDFTPSTGPNRLEANREILRLLSARIEAHPELRFGQILIIDGVIETKITQHNPVDISETLVDPFYEESVATLARIRAHIGDDK